MTIKEFCETNTLYFLTLASGNTEQCASRKILRVYNMDSEALGHIVVFNSTTTDLYVEYHAHADDYTVRAEYEMCGSGVVEIAAGHKDGREFVAEVVSLAPLTTARKFVAGLAYSLREGLISFDDLTC